MRILIIQGHPDGSFPHFCHALADAYEWGATNAGHDVQTIDLGKIDVPLLRSKAEWESASVPVFAQEAQDHLVRADHLVFVYPLWMGTMPALLKAWLEQVMRPNFAFNIANDGMGWRAQLGAQSARLIVTMGMPAAFYRAFYFSHSLRSFERNILKFSGITPVRSSLVGRVDAVSAECRDRWLDRIEDLGRRGC